MRLCASKEVIECDPNGTSAGARATGLMPATIWAKIAGLTVAVSAKTLSGGSRRHIPSGIRIFLKDRDPQLANIFERQTVSYTCSQVGDLFWDRSRIKTI